MKYAGEARRNTSRLAFFKAESIVNSGLIAAFILSPSRFGKTLYY
jgi:hypothetical protein